MTSRATTEFARLSRRRFAAGCGLGAASLALLSLLAEESDGGVVARHHAAPAQSVVLLFMSGGPSQVDTFDPKPELARLDGQDVPASLAARVPRIKRAGPSGRLKR